MQEKVGIPSECYQRIMALNTFVMDYAVELPRSLHVSLYAITFPGLEAVSSAIMSESMSMQDVALAKLYIKTCMGKSVATSLKKLFGSW